MNAATFAELFSAIDGARYTEFDPVSERLFVWNGGHTVNIFDNDGKCRDMFMVGTMAKNSAELEEVIEEIRTYGNEGGN